MITKTLPGFWYCDIDTNGNYVASKWNSFINRLNEHERVGRQLQWTVLDNTGTRFAGNVADGTLAWEWDENKILINNDGVEVGRGGWNSLGVFEGLNPVIYNPTAIVVHSTQNNHETGALGWRYVDDNGTLISADSTINPESSIAKLYGITDLWQFTVRDNGAIAIGEGQNAVWAVIDKIHRVNISSLIHPDNPNCRSVRFRKQGNKIAVCWYYFDNPTTYTSCFIWMTEEELRAMISEPEPTPEPEVNVRVRAYERPIWQAPYYSFHQRYGDTPIGEYLQYGNAITVIGDETDPNVRDSELARIANYGRPMIVDIGEHQPDSIFNDLTVAWLAAGGNIGQLVANVSRALTYFEKPVIAYLDGDGWPDHNPFPSKNVWPSIQAYRFSHESMEQFINRIQLVVDRVNSYKLPMVLTSRFDDFNGSQSVQNILECMPFYDFWLSMYPFVGHMPFADRRGNGISKIPQMKEWATAINFASIRPNRFDYWRPSGTEIKTILTNKFGQSRANPVLEPYLREDILRRYL